MMRLWRGHPQEAEEEEEGEGGVEAAAAGEDA